MEGARRRNGAGSIWTRPNRTRQNRKITGEPKQREGTQRSTWQGNGTKGVNSQNNRARGSEKVMEGARRRNGTGSIWTRPNRTRQNRKITEKPKQRKGKQRRAWQGNGTKGMNSQKNRAHGSEKEREENEDKTRPGGTGQDRAGVQIEAEELDMMGIGRVRNIRTRPICNASEKGRTRTRPIYKEIGRVKNEDKKKRVFGRVLDASEGRVFDASECVRRGTWPHVAKAMDFVTTARAMCQGHALRRRSHGHVPGPLTPPPLAEPYAKAMDPVATARAVYHCQCHVPRPWTPSPVPYPCATARAMCHCQSHVPGPWTPSPSELSLPSGASTLASVPTISSIADAKAIKHTKCMFHGTELCGEQRDVCIRVSRWRRSPRVLASESTNSEVERICTVTSSGTGGAEKFSAPHQALALMWCCSSFEVEWVGTGVSEKSFYGKWKARLLPDSIHIICAARFGPRGPRAAMRTAPGARKVGPDDTDELRE
eukprot:gene16222-biopygen15804